MGDEPYVPHYRAWMHELLRDGPLDFYAELWSEQPDHPARASLARLAKKLGYETPMAYTLSRTLLRDVLHAAGGVEYHAYRVIAALDESQHEYAALVKKHPEFAWRADLEGQHVQIKESLAWEYANLLIWLRGVVERIDRPVLNRSKVRLGLLPAIAEVELREDVERLLQAFKCRVGDERKLANYGLHAAKVPDPSTPSGLLQEGGTILVPIPDPPGEQVYVFDQFAYDEGRDLRSFTAEALAATVELIDGLIDAFVRARERLKLAHGR